MPVYSKVKAVGLAGIISTVIIFLLTQVMGVEVSAELAAAIVTVVTFIVGWAKKELVFRRVP
jgi:hypothetical protein